MVTLGFITARLGAPHRPSGAAVGTPSPPKITYTGKTYKLFWVYPHIGRRK